jgi:hypothetical protein
MKGFSQFRPLAGDKGHGHGQIIFAHGRLEIGQRLVPGLWMACAPVHEKADHQTAEHAEDPEAIGVAHPATVIIERDVQALVGAVLNAPTLAIGPQPLWGGQFLWREVANEADGLVFASHMLTG